MDETTTRRAQYLSDAEELSERDIAKFTYVELRDLSHVVRVEQNSKIRTLWTWRQRCIGGSKLAGLMLVLAGLAWKIWG